MTTLGCFSASPTLPAIFARKDLNNLLSAKRSTWNVRVKSTTKWSNLNSSWRKRSPFVVCMAPEEEKMTRRSPLDFPIEWERPKPGRRPDIFPQFSPMKTPLPTPLPADPPEEDEEEEEEENKEEEEEDPEKEEPEKPDKQQIV